MDIRVSSLGFWGPMGFSMHKLDKDLGLEIFYEWGGSTYWDLILEQNYKEGRTGGFSIHAPFQGDILEMSLCEDEAALEAYLREPFSLYHKYNADGYVVHMNGPYPSPPTPRQKAERLKRVAERLDKMNRICRREGVNMQVENLAFGTGGYTLCDQAGFLGIFAENPDLDCIIDTGHAVLAGMDIFEIQRTLKGRLKAYHIHDNDGVRDGHQRIQTGVIDWQRFFEGARLYTPEAAFVMEYNPGPGTREYGEDAERMRKLFKG